jgi:hypothetical protein
MFPTERVKQRYWFDLFVSLFFKPKTQYLLAQLVSLTLIMKQMETVEK